MGFLDKLVRRLTSAGAQKQAAPTAVRAPASAPVALFSGSKAPAGPLNLSKGDFVTHYRERFAVVGHRVLEGEGGTVLFYCLKDKNAAAAVLVCEGGPDASFSLQRATQADVKWDADVLTGITEEPLKLVKKGRAKVRAFDDSGLPADVRSVEFRRFVDPSGDVTLCLDDYEGKREVRLGEPVYEAELEFERGAGARAGGSKTAAVNGAKTFEEADDEVVKGTPRAAAKALEQNMGKKKPGTKAAVPDHDPTAYDDDKWIDAVDEKPAAKTRLTKAAAAASSADDEDDEWTSASQLVRQSGANAIVDDPDLEP